MSDGSAQFATSAPEAPPPNAGRRPAPFAALQRRLGTGGVLALMMTAYFAVAATLAVLRYAELNSSNFDLGGYAQALYSAGHGHGFFATEEYEINGATSLLRVHPSPLLYPLAGLYAVFPTPLTLLVLQPIPVALAALPLYLITLHLTGSTRRSLFVAALYLSWAPLLAANLFDFHLEAFLPVELFALFYLFLRGRYLAAYLVAALAFATFEVAPLFILLTGAFFLLVGEVEVRALSMSGAASPAAEGGGPVFRPWMRATLGRAVETVQGRAALGLMIASVAALALLEVWGSSFGPLFTGTSGEEPVGLSSLGTPHFVLDIAWLGHGFVEKAIYWIVLYALVGFLPLLARRHAILAAPWIAATLVALPVFTAFGSQYAFIAAYPMFIGVALGLRSLPQHRVPPSKADPKAPPSSRRRARWARGSAASPWAVPALCLLGLNLLLSPVDPLAQGPNGGPGYDVSYTVPPGWADLQQIVGLIPAESYVYSTDHLFPYVADDVHAYDFLDPTTTALRVPFNVSFPPTYVLFSAAEAGRLPTWLTGLLYSSDYGLRGLVGASPLGTIYLFEQGFHGPAVQLSTTPFPVTTYAVPQLFVGPAAVLTLAASGPEEGHYIIAGSAGTTGTVWYGPYVSLPAGNYSVHLLVQVAFTGSVPAPTALLGVDVTSIGGLSWYSATYPAQAFRNQSAATITFSFFLPEPTPLMEVRGFELNPMAPVSLLSMVVAPGP